MILPCLAIAPSSDRGRGVFTTEPIAKGTIVEISPVLVLGPDDRQKVEQTLLFDYIFEWGNEYKGACVALGYLSLYNHSYNANCLYEMDFEQEIMRITSVKEIAASEELFINYNAEPDDEKPIWFEAK
jgi:SET domain-containing protein